MSRPDLSDIRRRLAQVREGELSNDQAISARDRLIDDLLAVAGQPTADNPPDMGSLLGGGDFDLLQVIVDAVPAAITLRDLDGRYLLVNSATPAASGLSVPPKEFIGRRFIDLQPLGGASEHVRSFEQVVATGEPVLDIVYESAVTPGRWRQMSAIPLRDPDGRMACVFTIGLDVTDRELAQNALRESERRLSGFVRNLPGAAYRLRYSGDPRDERAGQCIEFISEGCIDLLGFSPGQLTEQGMTLRELVHPDDRASWHEGLVEAYRAGGPADLRVRVVRSDGAVRWVLQRSQVVERNEDGLVAEGLMVDIDAQVRAETALAARQELLQTVIDTVPAMGVTMCDASGRYQFANAFAARNHNPAWTAADLIGRRREELDSPRPLMLPGRIHDEIIRTGEPILGREYPSEATPGSWRQLYAAPVRAEDGSIDGVVQIHVDITRLKQVEQDLEQHRDRLEELVAERTAALSQEIAERKRAEQALARNERLAAVGEVAATVSHELRNPLGTIKSSLFVLDQDGGSRTSGQRRARERIDRSIDRCVHIIEQMLDFTRMRALDFQLTDMNRWCRDILAETAIPEEVEVVPDLECSEPVRIDRENIRHVLVNVLENAWQALIEDPDAASRSIVVRARTRGDSMELAVIDQGPGIEPEDMERIFEPLFSTRPFGVGLGLPLVKRLVEEHEGTLHIDSTPGRGTTVSIRLPRR